jgi:hypothetical protein
LLERVLDAEAIYLTGTSGIDVRPTTTKESDHEKEVR